MGYYIEVPKPRGKVSQICDQYPKARVVSQGEAANLMADPTTGVVCVVMNPCFEAAGFCYNQREFQDFTRPEDQRPKQFVAMPRRVAERASGYAVARYARS